MHINPSHTISTALTAKAHKQKLGNLMIWMFHYALKFGMRLHRIIVASRAKIRRNGKSEHICHSLCYELKHFLKQDPELFLTIRLTRYIGQTAQWIHLKEQYTSNDNVWKALQCDVQKRPCTRLMNYAGKENNAKINFVQYKHFEEESAKYIKYSLAKLLATNNWNI